MRLRLDAFEGAESNFFTDSAFDPKSVRLFGDGDHGGVVRFDAHEVGLCKPSWNAVVVKSAVGIFGFFF